MQNSDKGRKGIILAGGTGSRLYPSTLATSKQLMPIYDKPMIYYPLSVLMDAGIRDILIITTPHDQGAFKKLLSDGSQWGMNIEFAVQPKPDGLAEALIIAEPFLDGHPSALILGDNLFFGLSFTKTIRQIAAQSVGASIFGYHVKNPSQYGVVTFDEAGRAISIIEKPKSTTSQYAVTGLYFYDAKASEYAKHVKPSPRGELEITDLNRIYLERGELTVIRLGSNTTWLDTGTHRSLLQASQFVSVIEERQGRRICCPEMSALHNGWISHDALAKLASDLGKSAYGQYLLAQANMPPKLIQGKPSP